MSHDAHLALTFSTKFEVDTTIPWPEMTYNVFSGTLNPTHFTSLHPMPRYSVIAADTLRDIVTFTFDLLTLVSGHTWPVTWSTPPPSLKFLWLSVLEL